MMNMDEKGRLRRLALSKRDAISAAVRESKSAAIAARLLALPEIAAAQTVMCYRSFRSEVSTDKIVENFRRMGKKLCFPLCEKAGIMHAYSPNDESAWKKGSFGIMEPVREASILIPPQDIELVICPLLSFDEAGHRLGYGGGYYDRYLPQCKRATKIAIAFEEQRLEQIPTDCFDMAMDMVITENRTIVGADAFIRPHKNPRD